MDIHEEQPPQLDSMESILETPGLPDIDHAEFVRGYIAAALFSSYDTETEEALDACHDIDDLDPDLRAHVESECTEFIDANKENLVAFMEAYAQDAVDIGRDFWHTRNNDATGFLDHTLGEGPAHEVSQQLADASHAYGNEEWYIHEEQITCDNIEQKLEQDDYRYGY